MTYGIFHDALRGLNDFRLFYPKLNFQYEVYIYPDDRGDENYIGLGHVTTFA